MSDAQRADLKGHAIPLAINAIAAIGAFVLANCLNGSFRHPPCADCQQPVGIPFAFWRTEGFADPQHILWTGIIADLACIATLSAVLTFLWTRISSRHHG
jgi:hypothetical protein